MKPRKDIEQDTEGTRTRPRRVRDPTVNAVVIVRAVLGTVLLIAGAAIDGHFKTERALPASVAAAMLLLQWHRRG